MIIKVFLVIQLASWYEFTTATSPGQPSPQQTPPPPPYSGAPWPDIRCVPGWYDEQSDDDVSGPLAESRSAGVKLLRKLNGDCFNHQDTIVHFRLDDSNGHMCLSTCTFIRLGLHKNKGSVAASAEEVKNAFAAILTGVGGNETVADLVNTLYPEWRSLYPYKWGSQGHPEWCTDVFWEQKLRVINHYFNTKRDPSCVLQFYKSHHVHLKTFRKQPNETEPQYKEWLDFASQESVRNYLAWPKLSFFAGGQSLEDVLYGRTQQLLESKREYDLSGLWKLTDFSRKCLALTNKEKLLPEAGSWMACYKMCFLAEMKIIKSPWDQENNPTVVGNVDEVTSVMRSLQTDGRNFGFGGFVSPELVSDAVANTFVMRATRYLQKYPGISCHNSTRNNHSFFDYVIDEPLGFQDGVKLRMYEYEHDAIVYPTIEEATSNTQLKLWPDISCVESWVTPEKYSKSTIANITRNLYMHNRDCHDLYNLSQFRKEFGGEQAVSSCIKVCILIGLKVAAYRPYSSYQTVFDEKVGPTGKSTSEWCPLQQEITYRLYRFLYDKFPNHYYSECNLFENWSPTFQAVDNFFERKCKGLYLEDGTPYTTPAPPPPPPPPPPYTGDLWPDFKCVPGWYAEQTDSEANDDPSASSSPRSAGAKLLRKIHGDCVNSPGSRSRWSTYPIEECVRKCIMGQIGLINSTSNTAASAEVIKSGLATILTDEGSSDKVADLVDKFYPEWSASHLWNLANWGSWSHPENCPDFFWEEKPRVIDHFLKTRKEPSCLLQLKAADNAIYKASGHIMYTAELDLSCYVDFTYKGLDYVEGANMGGFVWQYNECNELILRKGLKSDCMAICMFYKLGLFQWQMPNVTVPTLADIAAVVVNQTEDIGTRFFGYMHRREDFAERGKQMDAECRPIFERVQNRSCAVMQELSDCIERVFSCNYSGKFLRNQTQLERSQPPKKGKLMDHQGFPDMSCRQGYQKSKNPKRGSGLLKMTSIACRSLMEAGYYKCEKLCILGELGILVVNGTDGDGEEEGAITRYRFNDEQEIILKLTEILGDFGGWDTANQIAAELGNCTHSLQQLQLGEPNCDSVEWTRFSLCVSKAMECQASILFGYFPVLDEPWYPICDPVLPPEYCNNYFPSPNASWDPSTFIV